MLVVILMEFKVITVLVTGSVPLSRGGRTNHGTMIRKLES